MLLNFCLQFVKCVRVFTKNYSFLNFEILVYTYLISLYTVKTFFWLTGLLQFAPQSRHAKDTVLQLPRFFLFNSRHFMKTVAHWYDLQYVFKKNILKHRHTVRKDEQISLYLTKGAGRMLHRTMYILNEICKFFS
jgi:predicted LPLAT superfamily acyltransferase